MARDLQTHGDLRSTSPFAAFLRRLARSRLHEMMAHEAGARVADPEALHDLRVAARRLRSALRLTRDLFPGPPPLRKLERALTKLARTLGGVRDLDVLLLDLEAYRAEARPADLPHLDGLAQSLTGRRGAYREEMERALRAFARPRRLAAFEASLRRLRVRSGRRRRRAVPVDIEPDTPTLVAARRILPVLLEAALSHAPAVRDPAAEQEHHRLRIATKRLRYAMETFAFLFPPEFSDLIPPLRRIQDLLGRVHDDDVFVPTYERHVAERRRQAEGELRRAVFIRDESKTAPPSHPPGSRPFPISLDQVRQVLAATDGGERESILRLILRTRTRRRQVFAEFQALWLDLTNRAFREHCMAAMSQVATPRPTTPGSPGGQAVAKGIMAAGRGAG